MTGTKLVLTISVETTQGIHDFLDVLGQIQEEIKGGYESGNTLTGTGDVPDASYEWKIMPVS